MSGSAEASGGARRFRRRGRAWAWQLEKAFDWETPRGDRLQGSPGDWWVITEDGSSRTVKPRSFAATYAQIKDQEYRRAGVVTARQATEPEIVQTQEGEATAAPGDWIVTDADGASWPVPPETFAAGYEEES